MGIYVQVETVFDGLGVSDLLTNPAIALIILGGFLFIIGFLGCFGALLEFYYVLIIVSTVLSTPYCVTSLMLSPLLCSIQVC